MKELQLIYGLSLISISYCVIDYSRLPLKHELDDFDDCFKNDQYFCKIFIRLHNVKGKTSNFWKHLESVNNSYGILRYDELMHGKCCNKGTELDIKRNLEIVYNEKYNKENVRAEISKLYVVKDQNKVTPSYYDQFLNFSVLFYLLFVIWSTYRTFRYDKVGKIVSIFSLKTILKELWAPRRSADYQNLKSIQGLRVFGMALIILVHCFLIYSLKFNQNPQFIDEFYTNEKKRVMLSYFSFGVQYFFLFSPWLLSVQIQNIIDKNGKLYLRDVFLLILNRYLRLIPSVILAILFASQSTGVDFVHKIYRELAAFDIQRCHNNAWYTLSFINNFLLVSDMCVSVSWYLSTDFQLYILSSLILYLKYRYNIKLRYQITLAISLASLFQAKRILDYDIDGLFRFTPRAMDNIQFGPQNDMDLNYIHPFCNLPTYMMGLVFGWYYATNKNKQALPWMKRSVWLVLFFGLPALVVYINMYTYSKYVEVIWGLIARPLYTFGIAFGILGMSRNIGGPIKWLLEWTPLVYLGDFTFSTYLHHSGFISQLQVNNNEFIEADDLIFVKYFFTSVFVSYLVGILMTVFFEHPLGQLQKLLVPQPFKWTKETKKDE